jgi:hypothetical protein
MNLKIPRVVKQWKYAPMVNPSFNFKLNTAGNGRRFATQDTSPYWDEAFMGAIRDDWAGLRSPPRIASPPKPSRYASVIADLTGKSRQPEDYIDVEPTELRRIG